MQLRVARLCLDCEEVHDLPECPVCGSESFAYISRWVPAPERRQRPRPAPSETAETYRQLLAADSRQPGRKQWAKRGAVGLAAVGVLGWLWGRRSTEPAADRSGRDEPPRQAR